MLVKKHSRDKKMKACIYWVIHKKVSPHLSCIHNIIVLTNFQNLFTSHINAKPKIENLLQITSLLRRVVKMKCIVGFRILKVTSQCTENDYISQGSVEMLLECDEIVKLQIDCKVYW